MATNKQDPTKPATRRVRASKKVEAPVIDPTIKPSVEDFLASPDTYPLFRVRNNVDKTTGKTAPIVERKSAETPMVLPTGVAQPTDENGNVVRVRASHTKDDEVLIASIMEMLTTYPEGRKSWVAALRTARWTRAHGIVRKDGTEFLSCTTTRWGTNGHDGLFHIALKRVIEAETAKPKPVRKPRTQAPKPAAKRTTKSA